MGRAFEYRRAAKEKRWDKMSKVFPKLAKAITMAAKEGGTDPEMNAKLRATIATAKAQNLPKDNIEAAIKRANGKDGNDIKEIRYDGKASHGVLIIAECATDNSTRTVANVKAIFNKNGGEVLQTGSLDFMFTRKSVVEFNIDEEIDVEELELELIDAGLEELDVDGTHVIAYGDFESFGTLNKAIEDMGIKIEKSALKYIPNTPVELSEEQLEDVDKLIDKLEDDDDVQAVYTNIE